MGPVPLALPGWCGFGTAVRPSWPAATAMRASNCCSACTGSGRSSAPCCPTWTWCWPRATCASPTRYMELVEDKATARRISTAIKAEWQRAHDALALITGEARAAAVQPGAGAQHRAPLPLPGPAEPPAGGTAAPLPQPRAKPARGSMAWSAAARHPPVDQRHRRGLAQHRLKRCRNSRAPARRVETHRDAAVGPLHHRAA
jgi:hypothetical protein